MYADRIHLFCYNLIENCMDPIMKNRNSLKYWKTFKCYNIKTICQSKQTVGG